MDSVINGLILIITFSCPHFAIMFHRWTEQKYFEMEHFNRNRWIVIISCGAIAVFDVFMYIYIRSDEALAEGAFLYIIPVSSNLMWALLFLLDGDTLRDNFLLVENHLIIQEKVIKDIKKEKWWDHYFWTIDSLASGTIDFNDDVALPAIIIERLQVTRLHSDMLLIEGARKVKYHPFFNVFKKRIKNFTAVEIIERVNRFDRDTCKELYLHNDTP